MDLRVTAYGERGWLLNGLDLQGHATLARALAANPPEGLEEFVFGYANVLLRFCVPVRRERVELWLRRLEDAPAASAAADAAGPVRRLRIPVVYDGPDLDTVARATGLTREAVIEIHSGADYVVRMMGFAPGFPYLDGLDPRLHLERKASPRDRIEPGSVAIGGSHAGIYSVASPGGWHLLGRTDVSLFQPDRAKGSTVDPAEVFALEVGDHVAFEPVS